MEDGKWRNGEERKKLATAGYDYHVFQRIMNEVLYSKIILLNSTKQNNHLGCVISRKDRNKEQFITYI